MFLDSPWVLDIHSNHHIWHSQCLKFLPSGVKRLHHYHGTSIRLSSASRLPQNSNSLFSLHPRQPMTPLIFSIQNFQWTLLLIHGNQILKETLRPCHRASKAPIQDLRIVCSTSHTGYNLDFKGKYTAPLFGIPQQVRTVIIPPSKPDNGAKTTPLVVGRTLLVQAKQSSTVLTLSTQIQVTY